MDSKIWSLLSSVMIIALILPPLVVFHSYSQQERQVATEGVTATRLREVSSEKGFLLDGVPLGKLKPHDMKNSNVTVIMAQLRGMTVICTQQIVNTALLQRVSELVVVIDSSFPYQKPLPVTISSLRSNVFGDACVLALNGSPNPNDYDLLSLRPGDLVTLAGMIPDTQASLTIKVYVSRESLSLPEAYNTGAGLISSGQSHILFAFAALDPHRPDALEGLLKPLQGKDGIVGCPLITNETFDDQIISLGLGVDAPNIRGGFLVATQRLSGESVRDAGARSTQRMVPLSRPECLLISKPIWDAFGPFNDTRLRGNENSFSLLSSLISLLSDAHEIDGLAATMQDLV